MKKRIILPLAAMAIAVSPANAAIVSLVNSNTEEVTGNLNSSVSEILPGQTLYVGIPYAAGAWPSAEATDLFNVTTFLLGTGGSSTVSFNFYSATDTGTELSGITGLSGFTAGSAAVSSVTAGDPSQYGASSGVTAQVEYVNATGNPFASISNGVVWLGITNTGENTVSYYVGSPSGFPAPIFNEFAGPFDSNATSLLEHTYAYNSGGVLAPGGMNENVHPYIVINAETIPEPAPAAFAGLAAMLLLLRRRI
jgi:hypothetical protein